jgi:pimeloyl-ACP methyl ester carboxylesterase
MKLETLHLRDGRALSYSTTGPADGLPMLFFHSLPGSHVQPDFADALMHKLGIRLIAPDRPGFGESDFLPGRTVRDWPSDVVELADALGLERFRVIGASAGSPYVIACCAMIPERIVRAGIMVGLTPDDEAGIIKSAVPAPVLWAVRHSRWVSHAVHGALIAGMRKKPERALAALASTLSESDRLVHAQPEAGRFIIDVSLAAAQRGVRGWVYDDWLLNRPWGISPTDVPPGVRMDLWWGDSDLALPLEHGEKLAQAIPGAKLHVYPGEGHFSVIFKRADEIFAELAS